MVPSLTNLVQVLHSGAAARITDVLRKNFPRVSAIHQYPRALDRVPHHVRLRGL
jgi:hypothetical protein